MQLGDNFINIFMAFHKSLYDVHIRWTPLSCPPPINLSSLQFMNSAWSCFPTLYVICMYIFTHYMHSSIFCVFFCCQCEWQRQTVEDVQQQRCHRLQQLLKCRHNLCMADRRKRVKDCRRGMSGEGKMVKSWQGNLLVHWSEYFSQFYDYYYGFDYNYNDYYFHVCGCQMGKL